MLMHDVRTKRWEKNIRVPFQWRTESFPGAHMKSRGSAALVAWCPFFELTRPVRRKTYVFDDRNGARHNYCYPSKSARFMHRMGFECVTCGKTAAYYVLVRTMGKYTVWVLTEDGIPFTLDHHVPRARGGSNRASNLHVMCDHCNQRKGSSFPG